MGTQDAPVILQRNFQTGKALVFLALHTGQQQGNFQFDRLFHTINPFEINTGNAKQAQTIWMFAKISGTRQARWRLNCGWMGNFCSYVQIMGIGLAEDGEITWLADKRCREHRYQATCMKRTGGFGRGVMNSTSRYEEMSRKSKQDQNQ
jgi:hypothetical protein